MTSRAQSNNLTSCSKKQMNIKISEMLNRNRSTSRQQTSRRNINTQQTGGNTSTNKKRSLRSLTSHLHSFWLIERHSVLLGQLDHPLPCEGFFFFIWVRRSHVLWLIWANLVLELPRVSSSSSEPESSWILSPSQGFTTPPLVLPNANSSDITSAMGTSAV